MSLWVREVSGLGKRLSAGRCRIRRDLLPLVSLPARPDRYPSLQASIDLLRGELGEHMYGRDVLLPALLDVLLVHLIRACLLERMRACPGPRSPAGSPPWSGSHRSPI